MNLSPATVHRIIAEIFPHGRIVLNISCRGRRAEIPGVTIPLTGRQPFFPLDRSQSRYEPALKAPVVQDNESRRKRADCYRE